MAEDTIYLQNQNLKRYLELMSDAGIYPKNLVASITNDARRLGTPPQKLHSTSHTLIEGDSECSSMFEQGQNERNDGQADDVDANSCPRLQRMNSTMNVFVDDGASNCKVLRFDPLPLFSDRKEVGNSMFSLQEHRAEIMALRSRLARSLDCCEILECRLEEIADFLERLLNYDKYNGQLTPHQITSLRHYLSESRDISHTLTMTLLGNETLPSDCSALVSRDESFGNLLLHSQ